MLYLSIYFESVHDAYCAMKSNQKNVSWKFHSALKVGGAYPHAIIYKLAEAPAYVLDNIDILVLSQWAKKGKISWALRSYECKI